MIVAALWILGGIILVGALSQMLEGACGLLEAILVPILKVIGIPLLILFLLGLFLWWISGDSSSISKGIFEPFPRA